MFNNQKRFFKKKIHAVQCQIWDREFSRFKREELREEIRRDYDSLRAKLEILKTRIAEESGAGKLKETNIDEFKRLEDDQVILERDIGRRQDQLKAIDIDINGEKPSTENPEGSKGLDQELDAYRELKTMLIQYRDSL